MAYTQLLFVDFSSVFKYNAAMPTDEKVTEKNINLLLLQGILLDFQYDSGMSGCVLTCSTTLLAKSFLNILFQLMKFLHFAR